MSRPECLYHCTGLDSPRHQTDRLVQASIDGQTRQALDVSPLDCRVVVGGEAVDAHHSLPGLDQLLRDMENLGRYFAGCGVTRDVSEIGNRLWDDYFRR